MKRSAMRGRGVRAAERELADLAAEDARHVEVAVRSQRQCARGQDAERGVRRDRELTVDGRRQRRAGDVDEPAAAERRVAGRERRVIDEHAARAGRGQIDVPHRVERGPVARNVDVVVLVDVDPAGGLDPDVDLAVFDLVGAEVGRIAPAIERGEPDDQLSIAGKRRVLVADVGGQHAPVREESAAVVLGLRDDVGLEGRRQLADLVRAEAARLTLELEDAPAGGDRRLSGVLAGDEPARAIREETDLRVDVAAAVGPDGITVWFA